MSLQHIANQLAAQGRNGDAMLMHVTPNEVAGLQALAQHHGGSLTVNPQTGLPEANFLDDIGLGGVNKFVPAIAGAGLSFFTGMDPMTAAGLVGGLAGLSSGSLSEGIQAGLGAYGGASLTGSLSDLGATALTTQGYGAAQTAAEAAGLAPGTEAYNTFIQDQMMNSGMTTASRVGAGFDTATGSFGAAKDFLKDNKYAIGAAVLPGLMGATEQEGAPAALKNTGYIRRYEKNPVTGALEQVEAVPVDEFGSRSAVTFGGVGKPVKYDAGGPVTFGGVGESTNTRNPNDTRTDSQKAYDYLMGVPGAENPMLFYHGDQKGPLVPIDFETRTGGKYVLNASKTGYDWVPDTANAGLAAIAENFKSPGGPGGPGAPGMASNPGNIGTSMNGFDNAVNSIVGRIVNAMDPTKTNPNKDSIISDSTDATPTPNDGSDGGGDSGDSGDGPSAASVSSPVGVVGVPGANSGLGGDGGNSGGDSPGTAGGQGTGGAPGPGASPGVGPGGIGTAGGPGTGGAPGPGASPGASGPAGPGSGPGGSCFLTTAAVSHMNQKDNGEVLNALREFRDTYMRKNKEKSKDVSWYYENAPRIVAALDKRPDADKVYKKMYRDFIKPAYDAIQEGDDEHAYEIYKDVVDFAEKHSGIKKKELTPRYGPNGMAAGGIAALAGGGLGQLGGYSDGGQLLRGPGDGVSDSIPATIGQGKPARLADGEFVVPARIVSELGNGSTEAGAKQLYAMMARIQAGRAKTTGKNQVAKNSKAARHLPA